MKKTIRLTESDLTRIVRRVINEQLSGREAGPAPIPGQCLRKSGFTRESIGGPMTRRLVYEKKHNNITYQIDITGNDTPSESVRIIKNNKSQVCSTWVCDSSSPIGIKASDCKPEQVNYM